LETVLREEQGERFTKEVGYSNGHWDADQVNNAKKGSIAKSIEDEQNNGSKEEQVNPIE
jgi:hypothetical protein